MLTATRIPLPRQEHVYLPGVSYTTYEPLLSEVEIHRRLRITYDRGRLEISSRLQEHECAKKRIGSMIAVVTEELFIPRRSCGSPTFRDETKDCGLEPDECYYIQHEPDVRGKDIRLGEDPPPDLVVEVDITTSVIKRLPIYAKLGFPEIWQYARDKIAVHLLQDDHYTVANKSLALPMAPVDKLTEHLARSDETDETTWIRAFRKWVRDGMK